MPDKYEREIDEILRKASFSAPKGGQHAPGWIAGLASEWQWLLADVSPTRLLAVGLVLALVGYFLREFLPELGAAVSLLALALLLGGLALSMSRRGGKRQTGWRGRSLEEPRSSVDLWEVIVRGWRAWRQGRGPRDSR